MNDECGKPTFQAKQRYSRLSIKPPSTVQGRSWGEIKVMQVYILPWCLVQANAEARFNIAGSAANQITSMGPALVVGDAGSVGQHMLTDQIVADSIWPTVLHNSTPKSLVLVDADIGATPPAREDHAFVSLIESDLTNYAIEKAA